MLMQETFWDKKWQSQMVLYAIWWRKKKWNFNLNIKNPFSCSAVEAANHMAERVQQRELEAQQVKPTSGKGLPVQVDAVS